MSHPFDLSPEEMQERAENLAAMERNCFMRRSTVLDDAELNEYLASSRITGKSHKCLFAGFRVIFGFDASGSDFVVIKDLADQEAHVVFVSDQ